MSEKKYSEAKDLEKGESLMIFVGGDVVAYATSHSLSFDVDSQDVSSKMSGDWDEALPGKISWNIDVECLTSTTKGHTSEAVILQLSAERKPVKVEVAKVTRTIESDGSKKFTKGDVRYQGYCTITKVQGKSSKGEYASMSVTLKGSGPLMDGSGNELGSPEAKALVVGG